MTDSLQPWQKELFALLTKYNTVVIARRAESERSVTASQIEALEKAFKPKELGYVIIDEIRILK
jgi:hypothetical protein